MRKITAAVLALLAAGAVACGGDGDDNAGPGRLAEDTSAPAADRGGQSTAPAAQGLAVGKTLALNDNGTDLVAKYTLLKVERAKADQYGIAPESGGVWLLALYRVQVVAGETSAGPDDLSFVTKTGQVYPLAYRDFKNHRQFQHANLAAGQSAEGWVSFDVPTAALKGASIQLRLQNWFAGSTFGYWKI